ncbi:MAG TPA: oligosaccharide flippase family protein, partial [Candidatus Binataceae bacterium]|nr:oligosaccharide flippase family protein [Candidatus Binataceae bacterium]
MSARSGAEAARPLAPLDDVGAKPEFLAPQPAQSADADGKLWQAFARSVRDNVFAEMTLQAIRVGGMVVLARELMPNDFGIFRVLLIVMYFALIPIENGIPEALIQRRTLRPEHESTGWLLSVAVSIAMAGLIYGMAPLVARFMVMPGIEPYIRLLCIPMICQGTAMVANARLRREMRFGALASAEVFAEMIFLAAALLLLLEGYPRYSLPGALAARIVAYSIALWVTDRRFTMAWPRLWAVRDFGRFTTSVWGARAIYTCSANADFLLIGR